jgi:hypothetical protein
MGSKKTFHQQVISPSCTWDKALFLISVGVLWANAPVSVCMLDA